jgi:adenosine deaminase
VYSHELVRGMTGEENVLPIYLKAGVPVSIATDDEGIVRSELTAYFRRAVEGYQVDYPTLKQMVRASLEHAFVSGASLWVATDNFSVVPACAQDMANPAAPSRACSDLLASSEKAHLQWKEEAAFAKFEAQF